MNAVDLGKHTTHRVTEGITIIELIFQSTIFLTSLDDVMRTKVSWYYKVLIKGMTP